MQSNGSSAPATTGASHWEAFGWALYAALAAVLASIASYVLPMLNLKLSPSAVWFPLPTLAFATTVLFVVHSRMKTRPAISGRQWAVTAVLAFALALVALSVTGWRHVLDGTASLAGDSWEAGAGFQRWLSLTAVTAAGLTEEACMRGLLQLRVEAHIGTVRAQVLTAVTFILLHGKQALDVERFIFLALLAVTAGLLATRTKSVLLPAVLHAGSNFIGAATVLILRSP